MGICRGVHCSAGANGGDETVSDKHIVRSRSGAVGGGEVDTLNEKSPFEGFVGISKEWN
jgi:hypothetical protein